MGYAGTPDRGFKRGIGVGEKELIPTSKLFPITFF